MKNLSNQEELELLKRSLDAPTQRDLNYRLPTRR